MIENSSGAYIVFYVLFIFTSGFGTNFGMLLVGRLLTGFLSGMVLVAAPVYISETVSPAIRGRLGKLSMPGSHL